MSEIYKNIVAPFLNERDSETWHDIAREGLHIAEANEINLWLLEKMAAYKRERYYDERLKVILGGVEFDNPVMVGAGWDKEGRSIKSLNRLGFSGVEMGTVLACPQEGNPKPRQWYISPGVGFNKLGFNSKGMDDAEKNLEAYRNLQIPIGISIGKNKNVPNEQAPWAHAVVAEKLYDHASYFALNVSSPNTPRLRQLQNKDMLIDIVQAVNHAMDTKGERKPLFVKIAPDLPNSAVDDVIEVVMDNNLTGIIATNTTNNDRIKNKYGEFENLGGISGDDIDFRKMSTEKIKHIRKVAGDDLEIIGVGGIKDTDTALEKIKSGAKVIQVVTSIRSVGPSVAGRINRGLGNYLESEGIENINELIGADSK